MGSGQRPRGQRPWPDQRGDHGGLREGQPLTTRPPEQAGAKGPFAAGLLALRPHLAYLDVVADGAPGEHEVPLDGPQTGPERVRRWVEAYTQVTIAQSGVAPPGMPSAFVLQHHLDPFATVVATAAVRGEWVLDPDPARWWLTLDPTYLYPLRVRVAKGESRRVPGTAERLDTAAAGYRSAGRTIAQAFPAEEKMSSRQRLGMVDDMWEIALHRLVGGPAPERQSCCLMYALPGLQPCAGCPRSAVNPR